MDIRFDHFAVLASQACVALGGLFLSYFLATHLEKNVLGEYLLYFSISIGLGGTFTGPLGMWLTRSRHGPVETTSNIYYVWILLGLYVTGLGVALSIKWPKIGLTLLLGGLLIALAYFSYFWNSYGKRFRYAIGISSFPLMRICFLVIGVSFLDAESANIFLIFTAASALLSLIFFNLSERHICPTGKSRKINFDSVISSLKEFWPLAKYMTVSSVIFTAYQVSDKVIIRAIDDVQAVAELGVIYQWTYAPIIMLLQPIIALVYPSILQKPDEESISTVKKTVLSFFFIIAFVELFGYLAIKFLVQHIPNGYESIKEIYWIGVLASGLYMVGQVLSIFFSKRQKEKYHFYTVFAAVSAAIPAMCIFTYFAGVTGAMLGHLFFSFSYVLVCIYIVKNRVIS